MIRPTTCVHFTGIQHESCKAGVKYLDVRDSARPGPYSWPCLPNIGKGCATTCDKFLASTPEELAEEERAFEKLWASIKAGKSPCCDVPLDESRVVDGTGPRFCSKCKKLVFRACGSKDMEGE